MKRSPLKRMSVQRYGEYDERKRVVAAALRRDGGCVGRHLDWHTCRGKLDGHERIARSAWPGGHLVLSNVVTVCRGLHEWIDSHHDEAHALGLYAPSWERP